MLLARLPIIQDPAGSRANVHLANPSRSLGARERPPFQRRSSSLLWTHSASAFLDVSPVLHAELVTTCLCVHASTQQRRQADGLSGKPSTSSSYSRLGRRRSVVIRGSDQPCLCGACGPISGRFIHHILRFGFDFMGIS